MFNKMIYDISKPLSESTPVYPGDPPVRVDRLSDVASGAEFTLSGLSMSLHAGTHVDAPSHFIAGGPTVDEIPLAPLIGPALLVDIPNPGPITPEVMKSLSIPPNATRILFRTPDTPDDTALDAPAVEQLVESGVKLVGIDRMSIATTDRETQVHRILLAAGVAIIESLNLTEPPPGEYRLICLPLKIAAAEAAPARAVLIG